MTEKLTCGCAVKAVDVPDDEWIGQGWEMVERCPTHNVGCPDGGTCHHHCLDVCWRVGECGPLSGVYPSDRWPLAVLERARPIPLGPEEGV